MINSSEIFLDRQEHLMMAYIKKTLLKLEGCPGVVSDLVTFQVKNQEIWLTVRVHYSPDLSGDWDDPIFLFAKQKLRVLLHLNIQTVYLCLQYGLSQTKAYYTFYYY